MPEHTNSTIDERLALAVADLEQNGYQLLAEFVHGGRRLAPGMRVRHGGERWSRAIQDGTGTIHAVLQNHGSLWEHEYGRPDVELIVRMDTDDQIRDGIGRWADYHTALALKELDRPDGQGPR